MEASLFPATNAVELNTGRFLALPEDSLVIPVDAQVVVQA